MKQAAASTSSEMGKLASKNSQAAKNTNRLKTETSSAKNSMDKAAKSAQNLGDKVKTAGGFIKSMLTGAALWAGKRWLIDSNADMETYRNTLAVIMGDQKKAVQTLAWAEKFASKTPFEIPQVVEATVRMKSYGLNAQKTLGIVGDMASVMGKDLMSAVEAVADAQTGEVERLKEFGITKDMIVKQSKLMGMMAINSKGQITDQKAFNAALFAIMEKRFKGGMEIQSRTFKGMMSNVQDFIGRIGRKLGGPLFEAAGKYVIKLLDSFNKLESSGKLDQWITKVGAMAKSIWNDLQPVIGLVKGIGMAALGVAGFIVNNWSKIRPIVLGIVTALVWYKASLAAVVLQQKAALVVGALIKVWGTATAAMQLLAEGNSMAAVAQAVFNGTLWACPITWIVAGIIALVAAGYLLVKNWDKVSAWLIGAWNWIKATAVNVWNSLTAYFREWGPTILATILGPVAMLGVALATHWDQVKAWFTSILPEALKCGQAIIKTIAQGVANAGKFLVDKVKSVFEWARKLLPFSDAKEGPFSNLTLSGSRMMTTLADGVKQGQGAFHGAIASAFDSAPMTVSPNINGYQGVTGVAPAGAPPAPSQTTKTVTIAKLIEKIEIYGADSKDPVAMVDEIISQLYERLKGADDILANADMGAVL
jgi:hypothetical protein